MQEAIKSKMAKGDSLLLTLMERVQLFVIVYSKPNLRGRLGQLYGELEKLSHGRHYGGQY